MSGSAHIRIDVVAGDVLVCIPDRPRGRPWPRRLMAATAPLAARTGITLLGETMVLEVLRQQRTPEVTKAINRLVQAADAVDPLPAPRPRIPKLTGGQTACIAPGVLRHPQGDTYVCWTPGKRRYRVDVIGPAHPEVLTRGVLRKWRLGYYVTLAAAKAARDAALSEVRRHWHPHMNLDDYIALRDRAITDGRSAGKSHTQETYNA